MESTPAISESNHNFKRKTVGFMKAPFAFGNTPSSLPRLTLAAFLASLAIGVTPPSKAATPDCATVQVQNVRPKQGSIMVAAYADETSFRKQALKALRLVAADQPTQQLELCELGLAVGSTISVLIYQDLNNDAKLNTNVLGIPTEPWGASGAPGSLGPQWATTSVPLSGNPIVVKLSQ